MNIKNRLLLGNNAMGRTADKIHSARKEKQVNKAKIEEFKGKMHGTITRMTREGKIRPLHSEADYKGTMKASGELLKKFKQNLKNK